MNFEWVSPFSTPQNNVLKFFLSSIIMYPMMELLVDALVSRIATREILRGGTICPHSTRIGSFGPNTIYWGSRHYRTLILFGALVYNALALAGEFGFDSKQVDKDLRGSYVSRIDVAGCDDLKQLRHLEIPANTPVVPAAFLSCFDGDLPTDLLETPYPHYLDTATSTERLQWCRRARKRSHTLWYPKFARKNFTRHCHSYMKERHADFQLVFNGSVGVRQVLQKRRPGIPLLRICCEANSLHTTSISGFAVGGFSEASNRDMLKFDLFGMRAKFALYLYNIPAPDKPLKISPTGPFSKYGRSKHARYFSMDNLACVELRNDKRILCLDTVRRAKSSITLNMTDWVIASGKGRTANNSSPALYHILRSGMIMSLTLTGTGLDNIIAENYRKMLALYEIMQLQGMQNIWSHSSGKFLRKTKFSQDTTKNIVKVIVYRMTVNKIILASEKSDEIAFERVGSDEVATMNTWALLFYSTPLITIVFLFVCNAVLCMRIRKEAVEADVPSAHEDTVKYRMLAITLSKIVAKAAPPSALLESSRWTGHFTQGVPVIGLVPRRGVGFIWGRSDRNRTNCDCELD